MLSNHQFSGMKDTQLIICHYVTYEFTFIITSPDNTYPFVLLELIIRLEKVTFSIVSQHSSYPTYEFLSFLCWVWYVTCLYQLA